MAPCLYTLAMNRSGHTTHDQNRLCSVHRMCGGHLAGLSVGRLSTDTSTHILNPIVQQKVMAAVSVELPWGESTHGSNRGMVASSVLCKQESRAQHRAGHAAKLWGVQPRACGVYSMPCHWDHLTKPTLLLALRNTAACCDGRQQDERRVKLLWLLPPLLLPPLLLPPLLLVVVLPWVRVQGLSSH